MGRIGNPEWCWVTIHTPGVPTGGKYGDPRGFARRAARHGLRLAWNDLWERFECYSENPDGGILHHWSFSHGGGTEPQPITEEHLDVFLFLRENHPDTNNLRSALRQFKRDYESEQRTQAKQEYEDLQDDVLHATDLDMGLVTPRAVVVVP